jgi:hypothetical protein
VLLVGVLCVFDNTNFCLPKTTANWNRLDYRIIEFENGEINKNIDTCVRNMECFNWAGSR